MAKLLACALAAAGALGGQTVVTYRSTVDRSEQPYALYVPKSYDPARRYALVMSLHEEDSNHVANLRQVLGMAARGETGPRALGTGAAPRAVDYLVACPLARGTMGYQGIAEQDVYDVLADVKRRYAVDDDRVYLTGSSMGGGGALWLALTRPDVWAAVAPVCADVFPGTVELAPNALHVPMRFFHGDADPAVGVESSRQWQRRLLALESPVEYIEYPGVRHNAWDFAYRNAAIFDWFGQFRRNANPDRVRLVTRDLRHAAAYWVRIDALAPGVLASLDAVRSTGGVRVETRDVDAFTLSTAARTVTIDGSPMRLRTAAPLAFSKTARGWMESPPGAAAPRGPIVEAVNGRHIYVYGAGDEQARRYAETAAAWSSNRSRLNLTLPVKSDREVDDDDLAGASLVLFGTPRTNRLMARFAPQFPMALDPGAADYGLLFIVPAGEHYILVSSGLPWWTGAEDANRGGYRLAPETYRLLSTFGDYILFKGSLANVLAEGRFDRNGKIAPEAAGNLRASGTVTISK
ncbi:MAG: alpha/beta hydrolase-fold protein [Candidatus Solibacter sp.]|jgi:pimeloyl-ACP methyl ester carboxylesterase